MHDLVWRVLGPVELPGGLLLAALPPVVTLVAQRRENKQLPSGSAGCWKGQTGTRETSSCCALGSFFFYLQGLMAFWIWDETESRGDTIAEPQLL